MDTVTLKMIDELTGEAVERTICALSAYRNGSVCWEKGDDQSQREQLERWISERGNPQHETILRLVSWNFN